jgi:hypothetical protein
MPHDAILWPHLVQSQNCTMMQYYNLVNYKKSDDVYFIKN